MHTKKPTKISTSAFTLTELIVVISILAILSAIGFVSIKDFYGNARDGVRMTDMKSIYQGLIISKTKTGEYPLPENPVEITDGTNILSYQGYVGEGVIRLSKTNKIPLDPKDASRYIYSTSSDQKKLKIMGYLESHDTAKEVAYIPFFQQIISPTIIITVLPTFLSPVFATTATDYKTRFPYTLGDKLGILLDTNNIPLQETITATGINIATTNSGYVAYFGGTTYGSGQSTGTGDILLAQIKSALSDTVPCNPITYSGYTIVPLLHNEIKIFTKPLTLAHGSGTGSLQVQCINGELDFIHAVESNSISCISNYVPQGDICVPDVCSGTNIPENSQSTATSQTITQNWTQSPTPGICTFDCNPGYTWNNTSKICEDITPPIITSITATTTGDQPLCNTIRFTITATDTVGLHTTPYSFDGGTNWQSTPYKDYTGTNLTKATNDFQVKDAVGNITTHPSNITGSSTACSCNLPWGGTLANGGSVTAYQSSSYACGGSPTSETRTCTNGNLSGSYTYQSSSQIACLSCTGTPWGIVAHGYTGTAYSTTSVACGNSCSSYTQTRTCTNGTMNGTYTATSCSVGACTCNLPWGGTLANGGSVTAYSAASATSPTACVSISQTRTCTNGVLSGTYTNQSCTQLYRSCTGTPWGTVAHGYSNTAYSTTSVAYGNSCSSYSQTRTCTDGTMNGSYTATSCSVAAPANCTGTPWGTVTHGNSVTAYSTTSVACGNSCSSYSQTRTCNNGTLVGSYTATSCSVGSCIPPVNGVCGSVVDLGGMIGQSCNIGTKVNIVGSGCGKYITWQCQGSNGGTTANCSGSVTCGCAAGGPACWGTNCCGSWGYTSAGSNKTVYDNSSPGTGTYTATCLGNGSWSVVSSSCNP